VRQRFNEVTTPRESRGLDDLGVRCVRPAVPDILHRRAMKQGKILRYDSHRRPQAVLRDPRDVLPIDQDPTVLQVIKPLDQGNQSGFACARRADNLSIPIGKRNVLQPDRCASPDQGRRLGVIAQFVRDQERYQGFRKPNEAPPQTDEVYQLARVV
jgi:hypothetical protein